MIVRLRNFLPAKTYIIQNKTLVSGNKAGYDGTGTAIASGNCSGRWVAPLGYSGSVGSGHARYDWGFNSAWFYTLGYKYLVITGGEGSYKVALESGGSLSGKTIDVSSAKDTRLRFTYSGYGYDGPLGLSFATPTDVYLTNKI